MGHRLAAEMLVTVARRDRYHAISPGHVGFVDYFGSCENTMGIPERQMHDQSCG